MCAVLNSRGQRIRKRAAADQAEPIRSLTPFSVWPAGKPAPPENCKAWNLFTMHNKQLPFLFVITLSGSLQLHIPSWTSPSAPGGWCRGLPMPCQGIPGVTVHPWESLVQAKLVAVPHWEGPAAAAVCLQLTPRLHEQRCMMPVPSWLWVTAMPCCVRCPVLYVVLEWRNKYSTH